MEKGHEIRYWECMEPVEVRVTDSSSQGISEVLIRFSEFSRG